jgi:putative selenium metabolism hydrolase
MKIDPITLCAELVRIPSLSGQEGALMAFVQETMRALGYDEIWQDRLGNTVGVLKGTGPGEPRRLLVDVHADTVAVTSPEAWQHDPYGGELVDGRLYGRGACDIKGGMASALVGLASVPRDAFCGEIWLSVSVAEEVIEGAATRLVLDQMQSKGNLPGGLPDYCVVVEPTQMKAGIAQKGRSGVRLQTRGVPAHTSRAELGVNAVYKMLPAIQAVRQMHLRQDELLGVEIIELVEIISAPFPGNSIVPDACRARVDCRLLIGETPESLLERFRQAVPAEVEVDLWPVSVDLFTGERLEWRDFHAAWSISPDQPLPSALLGELEAAGLPREIYLVPYCCNASAVTQAGVPVVVFGPGDIAQAHAVDEWVSASELIQAAGVYAGLAKELLS